MTISVKEAVTKAFEYAHDFYKPQEVPELMLEEVELFKDEEKKNWLVTLGYKSSRIIEKQESGLLGIRERESLREYKTFIIDAEDGQFISLKIRKV